MFCPRWMYARKEACAKTKFYVDFLDSLKIRYQEEKFALFYNINNVNTIPTFTTNFTALSVLL